MISLEDKVIDKKRPNASKLIEEVKSILDYLEEGEES